VCFGSWAKCERGLLSQKIREKEKKSKKEYLSQEKKKKRQKDLELTKEKSNCAQRRKKILPRK